MLIVSLVWPWLILEEMNQLQSSHNDLIITANKIPNQVCGTLISVQGCTFGGREESEQLQGYEVTGNDVTQLDYQ